MNDGSMEMQIKITNQIAAGLILLLLALPALATPPQDKAIMASSNGEGVLKMGQEQFKVTAAVVKLNDDGTADVHLVSDITVFVSGTWSKTGDATNGIDLQITGGAARSDLKGSGKLFLRDDGKSIASLTLQIITKFTKRTIDVSFVGK
jgi:hypothetical protein